MNLYIDIGNTRTKSALENNGSFERVEITPELLASGRIEHIVAAIVGSHEPLINLAPTLKQSSLPITELKTTSFACGVTNSYAKPTNLGVDRWLTLLAAHARFPNKPILIIDAGTALTIDVLTKDGLHLGGWIVPGFELMVESIVNKAPKVFDRNDIDTEQFHFGQDTPECVNFGGMAAQLGCIQLGVNLLRTIEKDSNAIMLLTGGGIKRLKAFVKTPYLIFSDFDVIEAETLVFEGMKACFDDMQSR